MHLARHTRFVEADDEDLEQGAAPSVPTPGPSVDPTPFTLISTISTDYDTQYQCYVLHLAHAPPGTLAAALSNRQIKLYSLRESGLQFTGTLAGHTRTITSAQCPLPAEEPHTLVTSSADGTVREWDLRTGAEARAYSAGPQEISCCATNGALVAAGAGDNVLFWDRRAGCAAARFTDTHFQDVTQVAFHPSRRSAFVSASEDGLIGVFDTGAGLDEDEGFQAALNIDTAVARLGFYGPGGEQMWCASGTESLHLWEWAAACDDARDGGNGALGQAADPRAALRLGGKPADYLIQCEYDAGADQLAVAAGGCGGAAALFPVVQPPPGAAAADLRFGPAAATLAGGHTDIVRSLVWLGGAGPLWATGSEDARLCLWSSAPGSVPAATPAGSGGSGSSGLVAKPPRGAGGAHMRRASPY